MGLFLAGVAENADALAVWVYRSSSVDLQTVHRRTLTGIPLIAFTTAATSSGDCGMSLCPPLMVMNDAPLTFASRSHPKSERRYHRQCSTFRGRRMSSHAGSMSTARSTFEIFPAV